MAEDIFESGDEQESTNDIFEMPEDDTPDIDDGPSSDDLNNTVEQLRTQNEQLQQRAQLLDQFEANPERVIRDVANRLGFELRAQGSSNNDEELDDPPRHVVESISQKLPQEMQFMAESLAKASWAANQAALRPLQEQQAQDRSKAIIQERDTIAAELDARNPTWRTHLPEMEQRFEFLKQAINGGSMRHPKFGTLQEMLLELTTGASSANATAARRMRDAAQNTTSNSSHQGPRGADVRRQINEAKSTQDKFKIAFKAAIAEHGNL